MADQHIVTPENRFNFTPESRDGLERVVVRLLEIAGRCGDDPVIQHELMQLSDELVKVIDEIK